MKVYLYWRKIRCGHELYLAKADTAEEAARKLNEMFRWVGFDYAYPEDMTEIVGDTYYIADTPY